MSSLGLIAVRAEAAELRLGALPLPDTVGWNHIADYAYCGVGDYECNEPEGKAERAAFLDIVRQCISRMRNVLENNDDPMWRPFTDSAGIKFIITADIQHPMSGDCNDDYEMLLDLQTYLEAINWTPTLQRDTDA